MTRAFIPADIQEIIRGCDFAFNIYGYFPIEKLSMYSSLISEFEYDQTNSSLESIGMKSSSTIANTSSILVWTFFMILFAISICLLKLLFSWWKDSKKWSWIAKSQYWIVEKLYMMMMFGYFIRNALEMSQFILISSINEIYISNISETNRLISFIFSVLILLFFTLMVGFAIYLSFSSYRLNEDKHNKLGEYFRGFKQERKHKLYVVILLLRRLLFVVLLVTWNFISSRTLIGILIVIQVIYTIYLFYLRPYKEVKWNIIKILNEIYFGFLIIFLVFVNTEDQWDSVKTNLYIWVIVSNTLIVFTIILSKILICNGIGYFIKDILNYIKNKWTRNAVINKLLIIV